MLRKLYLFFRLPGRQAVLLAEAVAVLALARMALWLPFRWIRPALGRPVGRDQVPAEAAPERHPRPVGQVAWVLKVAARNVPWDCTCLVRALAGRLMLRRRGYATVLYLGVAPADETSRFHAWLKQDRYVVTGGGGLERYTVISAFV